MLSTSAKSAVTDLDVEHQLNLPTKVTSTSHKIYHFTSNQLPFHFQPGELAGLHSFPTPSLQPHLQPVTMSLTEWQFYAMQVTERTASALSLLGAAFIISTFSVNKNFHKPINRLVFYACFGNVMANIGTLISTSGVSSGPDGPLCQFQAFLIQMFLPADALWTLAMAWNVYLAFFCKYSQRDLRRLEWKYGIFCYGLPLVPALSYLFITAPGKGKIYGSAVMWCWVSLDFDVLRVATFYGPVWVVISMIFALHIRIGLRIFKKGSERRKLHAELEGDTQLSIASNPFLAEGITRTTEIAITYEVKSTKKGRPSPLSPIPNTLEIRNVSPPTPPVYSYTVEGGYRAVTPSPLLCIPRTSVAGSRMVKDRRWSSTMSKGEWSYYKCAMLFFIALLVTWVPSSINRVYELVFPTKVSFGLSLVAGIVLPLQGFWNTVIYVATSLPACKALVRGLAEKMKGWT